MNPDKSPYAGKGIVLLDMRGLMRKLHISRTISWQLRKEEGFPKPLKITSKRLAWLESEIDDWILAKAEQR